MHVAQFDRRLVQRILHRDRDRLDGCQVPERSHTEYQQQFVRLFEAGGQIVAPRIPADEVL